MQKNIDAEPEKTLKKDVKAIKTAKNQKSWMTKFSIKIYKLGNKFLFRI